MGGAGSSRMPLAADLRRSSADAPGFARSTPSVVIGLLLDECQRNPGGDAGLASWENKLGVLCARGFGRTGFLVDILEPEVVASAIVNAG